MISMPLDTNLWQDQNVTISEVYDKLTVQGEGASVGRPCTFVRFGLCNLECAWCDTPYTWDWQGKNGVKYEKKIELGRGNVRGVLDRLVEAPRLVITGGEPLLQPRALLALAALAVWEKNMIVEIETNGTLLPHDEWPDNVPVQWNVSPKLAHSGMDYGVRIDEEVLVWFSLQPDVNFKFVCCSPDDVHETAALLRRIRDLGGGFMRDKVWIMPEGITPEDVREHGQIIAEAALSYGFNITPRLHVELWGTERGR
jgi:7-carboxy-7-deazaguanine synthase